MNAEFMRAELQPLLFEAGGFSVVAAERPRAEVGERSCWLQYPLRVRTRTGDDRNVTVLGSMFMQAGDAETFEEATLAPQARRVARGSGARVPSAVIKALALAVSVFPVNGSLPTLVDATDPRRVAAVLAALLSGQPSVVDVQLVELRRARGCVLRYLLDSEEHPVVYGKVGQTAVGDVVREGLDALALRFAASGDARLVFPRGLGHSSKLDLTLVTEVAGSPLDLGIEGERRRAVDAAAHAVASLHTSGVRAGALRLLEDEVTRARDAVRMVGRDAPELAGRLTRVLDGVTQAAARSAPQPPRFAHGSFAPSQLMFDGPRVGVLDFDRLCQAEPALDLGRYLAPLRVTLAKRNSAEADGMASRFLQRYEEWGDRPASARVPLHECTALVRMAARSWLQLKASRLRMVSRILEERARALGIAE